MKALTIQQPWATLIALGEKRFETRSRKTNIRGRIAIHAGKKINIEACNQVAIMLTLSKYGYDASNLPTGAVIATVDLIDCHKVTADYMSMYDEEKAGTETGRLIEGDEWWLGDYTEGRHAWELSNVKQIEPIPAKGQQGWWNWESEVDE